MKIIKINKNIKPVLKSHDGKFLHQLHNLHETAPEFFYSSISQNGKVNLEEIFKFKDELNKLKY
jgi:hypothetical protein